MRVFLLVAAATASLLCGAAENGRWRATATAAHDRVVVSNGTASVDRDAVCSWKALRDGNVVAMGAYRINNLKPGRAVTNGVPGIVRELLKKDGLVSLRIVFNRLEMEEDDDPVKRTLYSDQIDFPASRIGTLPSEPGGPVAATAGGALTFRVNDYVFAFDRATGLLKQMTAEGLFGRSWLTAPLALAGGYSPEMLRISTPTNLPEGTVFQTVVRWHAPDGANDLDAVTRWTVRNDGVLLHVAEFRASDPDALLRSGVGMRLPLAAEEPVVQYFGDGRGPKEPAASGAMLGQWTLRLPDSPASGSCTNVRAVAVDPGAKHLSVVATEKPFDVDYRLGKTSELVIRPQNVTTDGIARLAFALWPAKRLSAVAVPPPALPPPAPRGVSASGTLPFVKFHDLPETVVAKGLLVRMAKGGEGRQECRPNEGVVGRVKGFTFEASEDGKLWTRVFEGELADRTGWQEADFKLPVKMRHWRFEAVNGHAGAKEASVAEIKVIE